MTARDYRTMARLYLDRGWSLRRIAAEYGISHEWVRHHLLRQWVVIRGKNDRWRLR